MDMECQASSATLSKKLSNGHSFAGGSAYDGVFAAPSKFGVPAFSSSVEDYREIFGGSEASRGSSIPFLDVPELNERKISVDVRSSELDYSKIFGGFGESSFAVRYEELSEEPNKRKNSGKARTQVERSSPSEASESSGRTEGSRVVPQKASHQAPNGVKKFNLSYNKVSNGNVNGTTGTNGTAHIAQLNAVEGYACLIDEVTPLHRADGDKPVFSVVNDDCPETSIREGMMQSNHFTRTTTDVQAGKIGKQTSGGDAVFQNNSNWFKSNSMGKPLDKYEVGHGTRPSKLRPSSSLPGNFNLGNNYDKAYTNGDSMHVDSPPYFGEEVDTNSVAATSAAALRKAIEEAQAKIKMAKDSMERKKAGLKNGTKPEERKEPKIAYTVNRSKKKTTPEKTTPELCKEEDTSLHVYSETTQQNRAAPCRENTDFEVREKVPSANEFDGKTPCKKTSSQEDHRKEEAEVSEVEQFYEVENTNENWSPMKEVDLPVSAVTRKRSVTGSGHVVEDSKIQEFVSGTKEANGETPWMELGSSQVDHGEEKAELMEAAEQFYEVDNTDKNWATMLEFEEIKTMQSVDENEWKEMKVAEELSEKQQHCGVSPKQVEEEDNSEQIEEGVTIPNGNRGESNRGRDGVKSMVDEEVPDHERKDQVDVKEGVKIPNGNRGEFDCGRDGVKSMVDEEVPDHERKDQVDVKEGVKIPNGNRGEFDCGRDGVKSMVDEEVPDHERKDQVDVKEGESEEIVQSSYESDKYEENPIQFQEPVKDDERLEIREPEDTRLMERQSRTWASIASEKREEEACKDDKLEKEQTDAPGLEDNKKRLTINRASKDEMIKGTLDELHLGKKIALILSHNDELEANGECEEAGGKEKMLIGDACQKEENESREEETCQWLDIGRTGAKIDLVVGDEEKMKAALQEPRNQGNKLGDGDNICKQDESDILSTHQKPVLHPENDENVEASQEIPACKEGGSISEVSEAFLGTSKSRKDLESVKEKYDMEERDVLETDGFPQGLELAKIMKAMEDTKEDFLDKDDVNSLGRIDMDFVQNPNDQPAIWLKMVQDSRGHIEQSASKTEKVEGNINESEVAVDLEDDKNTTECSDEQGCVGNGNNTEIPLSSGGCEGKGKTLELDQETKMSPGTEKDHEHHEETAVSQSSEEIEENCQESLPSQNAEMEEDDQATVNVEESTSDNSLHKEVELEKEHLRKIDEAKEREREREKERIAVERAIREARERAFAEARERAAAGRAAAGARQRAMAEARERVGRTSAERNDKSIAEKASREAKLKAERAAVERATAEARERALEKAMSGKVASEARKQNPQYNGPCSPGTSRYPNSSNHAVSSFTEISDGANGESAQRCKARSERHQRITERAEKALAEKNRRDILAQKEQAERHRLAETLDIEVKRWSSGKEGNLRALLSTLQYILGPDSGWQPIPLTEIITTTAVKKAYRKATLFVHPDKLQQRGANIQQKYTCEKVFDLLKEAWNKFNAEER